MSKMASRFAAVTSEEISQINEEAVPEKNEEGDKIRYGIGIYRWDRWKWKMKFLVYKCKWSLSLLSFADKFINN